MEAVIHKFSVSVQKSAVLGAATYCGQTQAPGTGPKLEDDTPPPLSGSGDERFSKAEEISVSKGQGRKPTLDGRDLQDLGHHCIKNRQIL